MSLRTSCAVVLVAMGAMGCGSPAEPASGAGATSAPSSAAPPSSTSTTPSTSTSTSTPTSTSPPTSEASAIARSEVEALLERWLEAQNRGDFESYAPLYASRFEGVRRTARATFRLDHDGWIADRRRLFGRSMDVAMSDVEITLSPGLANVHFTQTWSSGSYSEEGPKRIVIVREGDHLVIAGEEMLAVETRPAARTSAVGNVLPAFDAREAVFVVVGEAANEGVGVPREAIAEGMRVALRDLASPREALTALVGETFQLVGEHGVCTATAQSLAVAAVVVPHFGTEQHWRGEDGDDQAPRLPTATAQIAQEVDTMAERRYEVLVLGPSTCGHVRAAIRGTQPPTLWAETASSAGIAVLAVVLAGGTRTELVEELREGLTATGEPAGDDDALFAMLARSAVVREFASASGGVTEVRIPIPGECGGHARVFLLTRAAGHGVTQRELDGWSAIDAVIDVEGDGTPELLLSDDFGDTHRIVRLDVTDPSSAPVQLGEWSRTNFDCGC